ncbi:MAG TPA: ADOP family duplicated permease [Acidobacteriota bacterium]
MRRPPALGRWLLRAGLPHGVVAESIAGDLEQEFHRRARRPRSWYLWQVITVLASSFFDRIGGRSWFAPSPEGPRCAGSRWLGGFLFDLRFAARMLVQRPVFAAVLIGTLAVGIGINTAIFTVVNALLLRPIPAVTDPSSIVEIYRADGDDLLDVAYGTLRILREDASTLQDAAGWMGMTVAFRDRGEMSPSPGASDHAGATGGDDGAPPRLARTAPGRESIAPSDDEAIVLRGFQVTGNYFSVLGVRPALGRFFAPQDSFYPSIADEVVIGHDLWLRRYGRRPEVLGSLVSINGHPARIIGVAPEGFAGHQVLVLREVFVPMGMPAPGLLGPEELDAPAGGSITLLARLAGGSGLEAAREELRVLGDRFFADHGVDDRYRLHAESYGGIPGTDRGMVALFFTMLLVIVAMVLAVACVNVANMLLSRAVERRHELAIRVSLGAGRGRLVRQLLTEAALLFLLAAAAGLVLTAWTTGLLVNLYLPQMASTRLYLDVSPDARVFAFTFAVVTVTCLVFGLAPALGASGAAGAAAVRNAAGHLRRSRLRGILVAGQMALALVLLVAAGLMVRALSALDDMPLGYDVDGVYSVELSLELAGYDPDRSRIFYRELLDEVRAIPGVSAAATARRQPMSTRAPVGVFPEGIEPPDERGFPADFNRVSPDYFGATGIALLAGREIEKSDDEAAPRVAVINATMARRLWGGAPGAGDSATLRAAVGERFSIGRGMDATTYEVVGIAADAHHHGFDGETASFLYLPAAQAPEARAHLMIRADDFEGTIGAVRAAVARLDPDVPVVEVETMRSVVEGFSMGQRLAAWVAGVVGTVGLLLGAVGVYGVTAFAVAQRTHEIGVRMALGARAVDVVRLMVGSGLRAPIAGMVIGLLVAGAAARLIGALLFGISPIDPWTYATVIGVLGIVSLGATLLPARRAAATDPVETLRSA